MDRELQRRAFEFIERSLWFRPRTRARRITEAIEEFVEDTLSSSSRDRWFGTVLALPVLLPTAATARTIEGFQRRRINSQYKRHLVLTEERLCLIEDVQNRIGHGDSPYRESELTKIMASLPFELSALFTQGTETIVIRYTIHSPVEEWPDDRGIEGVCQLVMTEADELETCNVWREQGRQEIEDLAERIREILDRCLTCQLSYEKWTWNSGDFDSVATSEW